MQRGPILNGLDSWYLSHQFKKFRDGIRGSNSHNKAELLMTPIAKKWTDDKKIDELTSYISRLKPAQHIKTVKGNVIRGKELYKTCAVCHGIDAKGDRSKKSPSLIYLEDWYITMQLQAFKAGRRGYHNKDIEGKQMAAAVQGLEGKDFNDVVAYINSLR